MNNSYNSIDVNRVFNVNIPVSLFLIFLKYSRIYPQKISISNIFDEVRSTCNINLFLIGTYFTHIYSTLTVIRSKSLVLGNEALVNFSFS